MTAKEEKGLEVGEFVQIIIGWNGMPNGVILLVLDTNELGDVEVGRLVDGGAKESLGWTRAENVSREIL